MDLKNVIEDYIKNDLINYAIMIKGEWGSGKTFFIKKNVVKRYNNALYVSLYDVSSIERLSEKIYLEILKSKAVTNKISKLFRKIYKKKLFKILFLIPVLVFKLIKIIYLLLIRFVWILTCNIINLKFGFNISSINKKDFYGILKLYKKLNNYVLIIDDLERCSLPIEEVLGFINDFVEHNKMKCILIANEDELCKIQSNNFELKILTATNENIEFPKTELTNNFSKNDDEKITYDDLKHRINYLYDENNRYKIIKEKLIGKEFTLFPNFDEIYDNLALKYKKYEEFYEILYDTKKGVLNSMKINAINNIRTLNFYFDNFYQIYIYINKMVKKCKISLQYIYSNISSNIINDCICIKKGCKISTLSNGKKFEYVSYDETKESIVLPKLFLTFDFVNEYLIYNTIEQSNIEQTLEEFARLNCDKLSENDPFMLLNDYWHYTSKELNDIFNNIYINLQNEIYSPYLYTMIIKKISCVEAIGYNNKVVEKIIKIIREKIKYIDNFELDDFETSPSNEASKFYYSHIDLIKNDLKRTSKIKIDNFLNQLFSSENWSSELYNYTQTIKNKTLIEKQYFSKFDYKIIISKLMKLNINDIYNLRNSLYYIYNFSNIENYYISDLEDLKSFEAELSSKLKTKKIKDPMINYAFDLLLKDIAKIIKQLEN